MDNSNLLQVCVNDAVYDLIKLPLNEVINTVQNELRKGTGSPDVVFTSSFKFPQTHDERYLVVYKTEIPTLDITDCTDGLNVVNYSKIRTVLVNGRGFSLSEAVTSLPERSKEWPLSIDRCVLQHNKVLLHLNRIRGFSTLLPHILRLGCKYGRCCTRQAKVILTCKSLPGSPDNQSVRQLRLQYLNSLLHSLLDANGYDVLDGGDDCVDSTVHLHVAIRSPEQPCTNHEKVILVGAVTSRVSDKRLELSAAEFLRRRHEDVRQLAEVKGALPAGAEWLARLADAAVRIELLQAKPSSELCVDLCEPQDNAQLRGALFVLYNYTRISTILRLFADKVREGVYPSLVPIEEVDFSLLKQQEEWNLLSRYLLTFPHLVESCIGNTRSRPICSHRICLFLSELSRVYSGYYRRVRILTEPHEHLLPVMFARIHLLRAVENVFRNALSLLDITPLEHM
ncbi:DALR anticodon-binding domain-containing protein 3 [Bacillus rossius redtenbacheri]|uniref:DALR anticodon-binding domain-containing protein 3 n=1 Tax=Bacillus rossius redtenbacheri TaxID=93214 RepID=UPI002FDC9C3A